MGYSFHAVEQGDSNLAHSFKNLLFVSVAWRNRNVALLTV